MSAKSLFIRPVIKYAITPDILEYEDMKKENEDSSYYPDYEDESRVIENYYYDDAQWDLYRQKDENLTMSGNLENSRGEIRNPYAKINYHENFNYL